MNQFEFNAIYEKSFIEDPIPKLTEALERYPILRLNPGLEETFHVFRYEDIREILLNHETFSSDRSAIGGGNKEMSDANFGFLFNNLIGIDPPRHTRMRALASRGFYPKVIKQFESRAHEVVKNRISYALNLEEFDVVEDFSAQITTTMMTAVLGLPVEDWPEIRQWTNIMSLNNGSISWMKEMDHDRLNESLRVAHALNDYFHDYLIDRRKNPKEGDIISVLMNSEVDGVRFSDEEIQSIAMLLLLAGNETTTNLITNFVRCMAQYTEQAEIVRNSPDLVENALEETLRFEPSIRYVERFVKIPIEIHGMKFTGGEHICLWITAANRDPRIFDNPNKFDIKRKPNRHLTFSTGPHMCLGAPLARMESRIAARAIMEQTKNIQILGKPEYAANAAFNNIFSQKVRFSA